MGISISALDKKISSNLPQLNTQQKKVIWSLIKCYLESQQKNDLWEDKSYVVEMDRRFKEMESGKVKLHTINEAETHARKPYKSKKRKGK
jgi:hypothetical protein